MQISIEEKKVLLRILKSHSPSRDFDRRLMVNFSKRLQIDVDTIPAMLLTPMKPYLLNNLKISKVA